MVTIEKIINSDVKETNIHQYLKDILQNKQDLEIFYKKEENFNIYTFYYKDRIKDIETMIEIKVLFSLTKSVLNKIIIVIYDEKINEYDLDYYYLKEIHQELLLKSINKDCKKYTVRVYYNILHDKGFQGEYIINWVTKVKFKSLLNEKQKNTVSERIICFDCEVDAVSLSHARSKAFNLMKDFTAYLSVLIDTGFFVYNSYFAHFMSRERYEDGIKFIGNFQRKSFYDEELSILVMDNLNGLRHFDDYREFEIPSYISMDLFQENDLENKSTYIKNNDNILNKNLEKVFQENKINKNNKIKPKYRDQIDFDGMYKIDLLIPRQIREFYRSISTMERADYGKFKCFRNCCRLYNVAQTTGIYEATLMMSYMVAAVESLSKAEENSSFTNFMKEYLGEEYDKDFCEFLYGNIRSGHFHSGEFFFTDYNVNMDITFDPEFKKMQNKYIKGRYLLRKAIVTWIEKNLLNKNDESKKS